MNITERWRIGDWWQWMVTKWSLECTRHSVMWMGTERSLNGVFQFSRNGGVSSCVKSSDLMSSVNCAIPVFFILSLFLTVPFFQFLLTFSESLILPVWNLTFLPISWLSLLRPVPLLPNVVHHLGKCLYLPNYVSLH